METWERRMKPTRKSSEDDVDDDDDDEGYEEEKRGTDGGWEVMAKQDKDDERLIFEQFKVRERHTTLLDVNATLSSSGIACVACAEHSRGSHVGPFHRVRITVGTS